MLKTEEKMMIIFFLIVSIIYCHPFICSRSNYYFVGEADEKIEEKKNYIVEIICIVNTV
jgi:hypothetical protein